jgi:multiple sugar transport system substrate-binding protein
MTKKDNQLNSTALVSRRGFVKGLGVAGAALSGATLLPRWSFADDFAAMYASAKVDWKQASGQKIMVAGATHPWSNAITPLVPQFTSLTGIEVVTDFQSETEFLGALPIKLAGGSSTPDVFMFLAYGQGISAGWLEPLNGYYSDTKVTDLAWYDEGDLLKTAQGFPLWTDGNRYAFPITSEAMTMFLNKDMLTAKNLPIPKTFDELLTTAKALKTADVSGIAMRAKASGNSTPAAMGFVFSYGGAMVKNNKAVFDSPEAIAAIDMYGKLLHSAGPIGVGTYEWYEVLNDFMQGSTAIAIDSSNFATDISNPAKSRVAGKADFAVFPHTGNLPSVPMMSHWQACINAKSEHKKAAFLFLLWATSKPTSLQTSAAGLATTRVSAWSSPGFKKAFGEQAAAAALTNLQNANVDLAKAILFHPQSSAIQDAFMIGVNKVVSGTASAKEAMTEAAAKANAAIRG